jgi:hypothetical protein
MGPLWLLLAPLCQSVDLSGFEPLSVGDEDHCSTSFNYANHYSARRSAGFIGVYRTGDPLMVCFVASLGVQVNTSVLIDGEVVSSADYRWAFSGGFRGGYWLDLRLWMKPGLHTLLILLMPARQYFERHFSTVPRERLHERLPMAPSGPALSPRVSDVTYRMIKTLHFYNLDRLNVVGHASLQFVTCCDRKAQINVHGAGPLLPHFLILPDNMLEMYTMGLASVPTPYDELRCSAVIPSAVIWVNAYRQHGILHFLADKLPSLWYSAASMCAASEGASRLDRDCVATTHLIHRTWPTGHLADTLAFPSYMREALHAASDHAPSTFDFDDLVTAANDCAPKGCRQVCFRRLSVYYDHFMYHGLDGQSGVPSFWPESALDRRFVLWRKYRAHLLEGLGVHASPTNSSASMTHMAFLRRPLSRRTVNHDQIEAALVAAGFRVTSITPDHHSVGTLAAVVSSARLLCAVNSGVGNALFLPPNSGLLDLQPKSDSTYSSEPLSHDVMLLALRIHHIKYACIRFYVLPLELKTSATFSHPVDFTLNISNGDERMQDVPALLQEHAELLRFNNQFADHPTTPVRFERARVVQLVTELHDFMAEHAASCDNSRAEQLDNPELALWCSLGMLRYQLCFGDEVYTFSPEASLR